MPSDLPDVAWVVRLCEQLADAAQHRHGDQVVAAGRLRDAIALAILRFEGAAPKA